MLLHTVFDAIDEESFLQEISRMSVHEAVAVYIRGTPAYETSERLRH